MPSTPFNADHQESLHDLIGKVLPEAGAQHIAEAAAAAYCHLARRSDLHRPPFTPRVNRILPRTSVP